MKYCSHCGTQLDDEAVICPACGCAAEGVKPPKNKNELSTMTLVGFIFAFFEPVVGLVCSIIAYRSAVAESSKRNKDFAVAGIAVSAVSIGVSVVAIAVVYIWVFVIVSAPFAWF